ncbi:MAG: AAA family ATPase [Chloroflexi bacterium]|nr:AAA family ATPase [Chloroflexota bacterium]
MRIALTGKGGSGKTTLAATLARTYARRGYRVNALDGDPNPNLAAAIGISDEDVARLRRVPREAFLEDHHDEAGNETSHLSHSIQEVLADYGVMGPDSVGVLTMTGLLGAGKGCICGQHSAVRDVMEQLASSEPQDVTILDTEASIEHLSRGTVRNVDALLVVTEPYYRSLETAGRVVPLAHELGLPAVWVVANKVRNDQDREAILQYGASRGFEIIAAIPYDAQVGEADLLGLSVIDHAPAAATVAAIGALGEDIAQRLGAAIPVS